MPDPSYPERLRDERIAIDNVMLDPNNPRLATVSTEETPEERIAEPGIQGANLNRRRGVSLSPAPTFEARWAGG